MRTVVEIENRIVACTLSPAYAVATVEDIHVAQGIIIEVVSCHVLRRVRARVVENRKACKYCAVDWTALVLHDNPILCAVEEFYLFKQVGSGSCPCARCWRNVAITAIGLAEPCAVRTRGVICLQSYAIRGAILS